MFCHQLGYDVVVLAQGACSCYLPFSWLRCSAKVVCLYSKSVGLNGKQSAETDVSSVTAPSYVGLRVFGHSHCRWFADIPVVTAQLQTKRFVLLPQSNLLLLRVTVKLNRTPLVEDSPEDIKELDAIFAQKKAIATALEKYREKELPYSSFRPRIDTFCQDPVVQ